MTLWEDGRYSVPYFEKTDLRSDLLDYASTV